MLMFCCLHADVAAAELLRALMWQVGAVLSSTYTRLAPYLGTPKFAIATFILQTATEEREQMLWC